ncbi:MAG: hypothetical protein ACOCV4_00830 [Myxococcota bacterium]
MDRPIAILLTTLALASIAGVARANDEGYSVQGSYVAVGRGGGGRSGTGRGEGAYAASGFDLRTLGGSGHGGFVRVEHGTPGFFDITGPPTEDIMALDAGYAFGGPLLGGWAKGLLGFLELGLTGWQASPGIPASTIELRPMDTVDVRYGLGLSVGAAVEGKVGPFRVGMAVNRRDVPFFVEQGGAYAGSTTVQVRVAGIL